MMRTAVHLAASAGKTEVFEALSGYYNHQLKTIINWKDKVCRVSSTRRYFIISYVIVCFSL